MSDRLVVIHNYLNNFMIKQNIYSNESMVRDESTFFSSFSSYTFNLLIKNISFPNPFDEQSMLIKSIFLIIAFIF